MDRSRKIHIPIPVDQAGMLGRECLRCKKYFKIKPGTGLPTTYCHCPYCDYEGQADTFWTPEQIEYARSIAEREAYNQIVRPFLNDFGNIFKDLERKTRGGFLQVRVTQNRDEPHFHIKRYNEKKLETYVTCDNCKLEFAIYGVFATCPDCKELNAFTIFKKSAEVTQKLLEFVCSSELDKESKEVQYKAILTASVSAFDGLGKALRQQYPATFPEKPKNLFQNLMELNKVVFGKFGQNIFTNNEDLNFAVRLFQVRHICEHNFGVVDDDFIKKIPSLAYMRGRKYIVEREEIEKLLKLLGQAADFIQNGITNAQKC
jgi:hypothetical protein